MRILHICLSAFYIDGYSYQENVLPRMHQEAGHTVKIIASTETFVDNNRLGYTEPKEYKTETGIDIIRLPYSALGPHYLMTKIRKYPNVYEEIEKFHPDFIMSHDVSYYSIMDVAKYVKNHPQVKFIADCHADFVNSAKTWVSRNILHKCIYKYFAKRAEPYVHKFYGVLPARVDFLKEVYKLPDDKCELLVMGGEDDLVEMAMQPDVRHQIRNKYSIADSEICLVAGGKIDANKFQILDLMKAVKRIGNLKMLFFGSVAKEYQDEFEKLLENSNIINVGWIKPAQSYQLFASADLVAFPGLHSVMWEQAVACGAPCIFRKMDGFTHIDLGGNCMFFEEDSEKSYFEILNYLCKNPDQIDAMKQVAVKKGRKVFSYRNIAEYCLNN